MQSKKSGDIKKSSNIKKSSDIKKSSGIKKSSDINKSSDIKKSSNINKSNTDNNLTKVQNFKLSDLNERDNQVDELKKLWIDTFGDTTEYVNAFFDKFYSPDNVIVYKENDKIVSALYMIDYCLKYEDKCYKIMYLYALATDKEYRGRGIMSGLIDRVDEIMHNKGYAGAFLIPAEESLYDYYGRFGFTDIIYNKKYTELNSDYVYNSYVECYDSDKVYEIDNSYRNLEKARIVLSAEQNEFMCRTFISEGGKIYINSDKDKYIMADTDESGEKLVIYSTNDYSLYDKTYVKSGLLKKNAEIFTDEFDVSKLLLDKILE